MPVVEPKPLSQYPWLVRLFFCKQERTYGKPMAAFSIPASSGDLVQRVIV